VAITSPGKSDLMPVTSAPATILVFLDAGVEDGVELVAVGVGKVQADELLHLLPGIDLALIGPARVP